jgi:AraC family transcriptional regulator
MRHVSDGDIARIRRLVGPATRENLRAVECYVRNKLGVFIPSVGQCGYAVTKGHTHPAWSFILYFLPEDAPFPITIRLPEAHCLCVAIEPDFPHEESVSEDFRRYAAVQVDADFFARVWAIYSPLPPPACDWRQFAVHADAFLYLKRFMNECDSTPPESDITPPLAAALEEPIVHLIARGLAAGTATVGNSTAGEPNGRGRSARGTASAADNVRRVIEHIERRYADSLSAASLAGIAGLSVSALSRRFHEETGLTPADYVAEVRIRKAKIMLDDPSKSVTDIALACGFYDASHFSSTFLKATGLSPSKYAARFAR